ncbi:unnamed protein product [Phytophthora fragariaefolia]|uniref:Unnamed protein product n=1 Tax=Phytophthora fragariaefolia TaxID=1490495 RepID=A0A9W6TQW3_9STRA|nr:unnamed protein product [Phytophthora fragariaefolia]
MSVSEDTLILFWMHKSVIMSNTDCLMCYRVQYRFEVYLGKAGSADGVALRDERTGPVSVVRNLRAAFGDGPFPEKRLIVIDRFYASVPLAMQLWTMGYYSVGAVQTNRKGLAAQIVSPKKANKKKQSRPAGIERGTFTYAESSLVPRMRTTKWWANHPSVPFVNRR